MAVKVTSVTHPQRRLCWVKAPIWLLRLTCGPSSINSKGNLLCVAQRTLAPDSSCLIFVSLVPLSYLLLS